METLDTVMLYVHGGGYFWGSINTHRYQIQHFAHKFNGRAFAVNYRKAPQYPWPCALQDVIAAYLYLIRPPLGSPHQAVSHSKIVFAGDSAGGGLCVTALTVLRDLGLPMPAGAVLISPWVDLTHSFPSVMQNFKTDIIPEYGFLSKPSTLWPVPTIPDTGGRVVPTMTNDPPKPGKPDTLKPTLSRVQQTEEHKVHAPEEFVKSQREMLDSDEPSFSKIDSGNDKRKDHGSPSTVTQNSTAEISKETKDSTLYNIDYWEPKPPKVLMENPDAVPLELRSQIQMYATTEQLIHPLVSPILQGSLGNLPPLYIITGDGEVLRDEIIYLAHKAAHPTVYPTREGVIRESNRQKENVEKFTMPTNVHLQVFDGMCHVLTVFTFTKSAKYAYWSVAEFIRHVSKHDEEHLRLHPFPERSQSQKAATPPKKYGSESDVRRPSSADSETKLYMEGKSSAGQRSDEHIVHSKSTSAIETGHCKNATPDVAMVRERVNLSGQVRPMEPPEALQALQLKASDIGVIKEAPALRWAEGQRKWDERYSRNSKRVLKQKAHYEAKAEHLVKNALDQGFIHKSHGGPVGDPPMPWTTSTSVGKIQPDRRWGPLDLQDERPPPTAIAGRRDTPEAVALLKKSIYNTAPVTHLTVPKLKTSDAIRAAFDPNDDPNKPPTQSVSEEQVKARFIWMHGLRMWDGLLRYIGKKSAGKAADGINATAEMVGLNTTSNDP
ncbi:hypothetical protein GALMADRAFT_686758 [Galerina marginata CBS 339.88]|uniref:Alpha/beta hydrolase fold-3 domain-containing protein n=1 Tax=Galerina marginata (strain CBS 339.88) TaxID=685588 RepID=A0A067TY58_GALM3|nr:hypothetical protein GALMADRAFT_686758 [Galerina marginata CBS 339.88]